MLFLILCLCSILIATIVITLKKANDRRQEDLAEVGQSLPSLDIEALTLDGPADLKESNTPASTEAEPQSNTHQAPSPAPGRHWKDIARELRESGHYELAIEAMSAAWPQWQYYDQLAITLRAAIREHRNASPETTNAWLKRLFRAAAEASVIHDHSHNSNPGAAGEIPNRERLAELELPFENIGVNQLRLLTKTDRRQMISAWGEPAQHISARTFLDEHGL